MGFKDLPKASGRRHAKAFEALGCKFRKKTGSHFIYTPSNIHGVVISIPDHDEVALGTLKQLLRLLSIEDVDYRKVFDEVN